VPPKPTFLGTRVFEAWDLAELARYIDWTPFFQAGNSRAVTRQDPRGREAGRGGAAAVRRRAGDAPQIIDENWFAPKAVIGFWPANRSATTSAVHRRGTQARSWRRSSPCASS
jgi:5-methyltetrahydrofolate--homocysteine methyltransferase